MPVDVFELPFLYSAITLSVPDTASVAEESESVQVCATLSDVPAGGTVAINIMLATSDGTIVMVIVCNNVRKNFLSL